MPFAITALTASALDLPNWLGFDFLADLAKAVEPLEERDLMKMHVDMTRRSAIFLAVYYCRASMFMLAFNSKSLVRNLFSLLAGPLRLHPDAAELAEASLLDSSDAESIKRRGISMRCD